ncbi:HTH DNA binding domain-containing protein [Sphingobium sp. AP50]|uniref:hypothetical protein n=1 Tax=Sphingobium sp. AP50 TaxID=1884369 RepID=UPI0008C9B424|nr:hypothetical protein [Sphingobium sp. AP50]SEJ96874.1 HTH DNA binding domain-containing protein [Sphingobium sp. AP50]
MALLERRALAWIDNFELSEDTLAVDGRGRIQTSDYDLTHWKAAIGAPIGLKTILNDPGLLLDWFGSSDSAELLGKQSGVRDRWDMVVAVEAWARACRALPPSPPLLAGGRMASLWRRHAPLGRGDTVASLLIGDRWSAGRFNGTQGGLVALGLKLSGGPWKIATGEAGDRLWLDAITAGARAHLELENRLRLFAERARDALSRRRRVGRLREVLLLAMARPAVTSALVARQLKLTSAGAIKLLLTAQEEGLLIERTGQASYRSYAVPMSEAFLTGAVQERMRFDIFEPDFWSDEAENDGSPEPR